MSGVWTILCPYFAVGSVSYSSLQPHSLTLTWFRGYSVSVSFLSFSSLWCTIWLTLNHRFLRKSYTYNVFEFCFEKGNDVPPNTNKLCSIMTMELETVQTGTSWSSWLLVGNSSHNPVHVSNLHRSWYTVPGSLKPPNRYK